MTRHLTKLLLAASALTVLAAAPAAIAAPVVDTKLYSAKQSSKAVKSTTVKVAQRSDRGTRTRGQRSDRSRGTRSDRSRSRNHRSDRNRGVRRHNARRRDARRHDARRHNIRHRNNRRGYRTNYRSKRGISFHFGTPGYSAYRWAPAAYSFYRPVYGSYGYYQRSTVCQRIIVDGWHHGYRTPISVKQCSNPWDGSYIVQGSERLVGHRW